MMPTPLSGEESKVEDMVSRERRSRREWGEGENIFIPQRRNEELACCVIATT